MEGIASSRWWLLFLLTLLGTEVVAQSNKFFEAEKKLTPSPTAASLGSYGGIDVKKSTGGIAKGISLFQAKEGQITYSPSAEYFSTGTRVNDWGGRIGLGWSENLTGLIQRTVHSVPDEYATSRREIAPNTLTAQTQVNLDFLEDACAAQVSNAGLDTQYDIFSYNVFGLSGSFIIKDGQALELNHTQNVRIEVLNTFPYKFRLTDSQGMMYSFGINSDIEYTQYDKENACDDGGNPPRNLETAWFLSKIESPGKDVLHFQYGSANYEYIYDYNESYVLKNGRNDEVDDYIIGDNSAYHQFGHVYCTRKKRTSTKFLKTVSATSFRVSFDYTDRKDLYGDKLLSKISLYDAGMLLVKQAVFDYAEVVSTAVIESKLTHTLSAGENLLSLKTRYFLTSLDIGSAEKPTDQHYRFEYFDPASLPHRFSFSQDVLGYYNGKINTGFVPSKEGEIFLQGTTGLSVYQGNVNLADREPTAFSKVGMLTKITYPTAGTDIITYESNSYSTTIQVLEPASQQEGFTNQDPSSSEKVSRVLRVPFQQRIKLNLYTGYTNGSYPYDNDGSMHWIEFQLWDATNNKQIEIPNGIFPRSNARAIVMKLSEQYNEFIDVEPGIDYQVRAILYGEYTSMDYLIEYSSNSTTNPVEPVYYGQRVKQITTHSLSSAPLTKSYSYKYFSQQGPQLIFSDKTAIETDANNLPGGPVIQGFDGYYHEEIVANKSVHVIRYYTLGSSNRYDKNVYGGQPVAYTHITEFQNVEKTSFIASEYFASSNEASIKEIGDYTPQVPLSNLGWRNGIESKRYYGSFTDGISSIAKEQEWSYTEQPSVTASTLAVYNAVIHRTYHAFTLYGGVGFPKNFRPYTVYLYPVFSRWHHLDSFKEITYSDKSQSSAGTFSSEVTYRYNVKDKLLAEEQTRSSKGEQLVKQLRRPTYMVDAGLDPSGVYRAMVDKHLLSPPVETIQLRGATQVSREKSTYHTPHPDVYVPSFVEVQNGAAPSKIRARYHAYDELGNVVSYSLEKGTGTCLVWGYGGQQVIAQVVNADHSRVVTALGGAAGIRAFRDKLLPSDAEITAFLAPLRTVPALNAAQVSTYTHKPLVGMTSQTDPSGRTIHYEYDSLNRLLRIRDEKGQILTEQEYKYASQP